MADASTIPSEDVLMLDHTLVQGTLVACATVLLYDLVCTLDQEIAYVWSNPWSISSLLFFANRYLPFVDTFLSLHLKFTHNSPETCHIGYSIVTWFIVIGTLISESILLLRTYAIWERTRFILITLCILALVVFVPAMVVTDIEYKSLVYANLDGSPLPGCYLVHASPLIFTAYVLLVVSETIMVILTSIKAYRHLGHSQSGWVVQMYHDGILFYFYVLAISLANILVPLLAPPVFANWLASPQRILHSILCNRVLFLILRQRTAMTMTNRLTPIGRRPNGQLDQSDVPLGQDLEDYPGGIGGSGPVFTEMAETDTSVTLNIVHPGESFGTDIGGYEYEYGRMCVGDFGMGAESYYEHEYSHESGSSCTYPPPHAFSSGPSSSSRHTRNGGES